MRKFVIRVLAIAAKEVRHVLRDPRSLYLALGMPVLLLVLFGYGVSFDMDQIPLAVADEDRTPASRALVSRVLTAPDFESVGVVERGDAAHRMFQRREAAAVLVVPRGFADDLARGGRVVRVGLLVDGADNNTATQAMAKLEALILAVGRDLSRGAGGAAMAAPIDVRVSIWFNPTSRSALFLVPGLTAYVLAIVAVLLTSLTVAREWERGSMQQLFSTPVGRLELIFGKLLPYWGLGTIAVLLVLASGAWVFDVPIRGSLAKLGLDSTLFILGMLGQGLLISVVARNQMLATQMATLSSMLPSMLLSGFVFPIENMPRVLQVLSNVVPARYFVHSLRGVMLRGNGFRETWGDSVALAIFAAVIFALALGRFKRELT